MYTCIIVDDHKHAVDLIKDHVLQIPQLSIILSTTKSIEALTFLDTNKPDIIFLDIDMARLNGIEFIKNIRAKWGNNMPKVVFTTGHPDYALAGYEYGVADFLVKPITFVRFKECTDRIINELDKRGKYDKQSCFFFADINGEKIKINSEDIIYIQGAGNYITVITDECSPMIYKTINAMQEFLPRNQFLRVHKSFSVAIDKIFSVRKLEIVVKVKGSDVEIPIGLKYKEEVLKQLKIT